MGVAALLLCRFLLLLSSVLWRLRLLCIAIAAVAVVIVIIVINVVGVVAIVVFNRVGSEERAGNEDAAKRGVRSGAAPTHYPAGIRGTDARTHSNAHEAEACAGGE